LSQSRSYFAGETLLLKYLNSATLSLVLLSAHVYAAEPAKLSDEQAKVLESARASALQCRQQFPDFICAQITHRSTVSKNLGAMGAGMATRNPGAIPAGPDSSCDVIEEQLTYVAKRENYEVVTVGGRRVKGITHTQIQGGAISGGEFGSVLAQIFEPSSHTTFNWGRVATLSGRRAYVFGFRVPKQAGTTVADAKTHNETIVSFSGEVFVDPGTLDVLEISSRHDMPPGFPIQFIERRIEYAPQQIAGKEYSLPSHSLIPMEDGSHVYVNRIDFKNYHRFSSESTIRSVEVPPN
jgi:hypothetical protein